MSHITGKATNKDEMAKEVYAELQEVEATPEVIAVEGVETPRQRRIASLKATLAVLGHATMMERSK
jgi:hypothetical protein